jgi:hypothetical protein
MSTSRSTRSAKSGLPEAPRSAAMTARMKMPATAPALALALLLLLAGSAAAQPPPPMSTAIRISRAEYRGWPGAIRLTNGVVEAIVVPAVGRVMQFRFAGEDAGPFWENPAVDGHRAGKDSEGWANYGGDKVWPAPQAAWPKIAGSGWPPPAGFDGRPAQAEVGGGDVTLVFPPDEAYGLQVRRRIALVPGAPVMRITTTFAKTAGAPVEAGIWTITQLRDPLAIQAPLPAGATAAAAVSLGGYAAPVMQTTPGRLTLARDPAANHKIGLRAGTLIWVGRTTTLRLEMAVVAGATYPDHDSAAEVYTNADPLPYVELELLGPLATMKAGDRIEQTVTYTLGRPGGSPAGDRAGP